MPRLRRLLRLCLLTVPVCLALGTPPAALAATSAASAAASGPSARAKAGKAGPDKAKAATPVAGKTPILTPAQLRDCETLKTSLRAENESAVAAKKEIDAARAAIEQSGTEIKTQLETLDRTSQEAIDGYNAKVTQRDESIDAYQAKVTAYNARVVNLGTLKDSHEKTCEARRYDDRDLADLKRGKK